MRKSIVATIIVMLSIFGLYSVLIFQHSNLIFSTSLLLIAILNHIF